MHTEKLFMMTKLRQILLLPALIFACIGGFFSCGVDRWPEYAHQTALDTWMYDIMQQHYLWYQAMPSYDDLNLFQEPAEFLADVRSSQDSYSFVDSVMDVPLPTYGFDYSLVRSTDNDTAYNALITYVIPGSPAAEAGLERGNWIMKVDTSYISRRYETALLQGTEARTLTLGEWKEVPVEPEEGEETTEGETEYKVVLSNTVLQLPAAKSVEDDPVHTYKVMTLSNGIQVGYLMYNSFTAGTSAEPEKYNDELRQVSREFLAANVQATILDFRYNEGGTMDCAQLLGSILVPASRLNTTMYYLEYNDKNPDKNTSVDFDASILGSGVNLNQHTLIVITSSTTAGAAEMLTSCLYQENGYPAMVLIGNSSKGQNVATEQFVNEEFRWSVNPVVCTVYNADYESILLTPSSDFRVSETTIDGVTDYSQYLPFGDPNERLLNIAIRTLEGDYPPQQEDGTETTSTRGTSFSIEKSVSSPASRRFAKKGLLLK